MKSSRSTSFVLEMCVDGFTEAIRATQFANTNRLELCSGLSDGGLTPSPATIKRVCQILIPTIVMIRPNSRWDFIYSHEEILIMLEDIAFCRRCGARGVAFAALTPERKIDHKVCRQLLAAAQDLETTFTMAFDQINNQPAALEELIHLGFQRVLTKGGAGTAWDNRLTLKALQKQSRGRITILAGGKVTVANWQKLAKFTGIHEFHGRALTGKL